MQTLDCLLSKGDKQIADYAQNNSANGAAVRVPAFVIHTLIANDAHGAYEAHFEWHHFSIREDRY